MKQKGFYVLLISITVITACGGNEDKKNKEEKKKITVCDCVKLGDAIYTEMETAGTDETKIKAIEDKYKEQQKECMELGKEAQNDPEKMKALEEEARNCR